MQNFHNKTLTKNAVMKFITSISQLESRRFLAKLHLFCAVILLSRFIEIANIFQLLNF